jgi:hypothetical protein
VRLGATVPELVNEFLAAKEQDGVSRRYLNQFGSDVNRFALAFPGPIFHHSRSDLTVSNGKKRSLW